MASINHALICAVVAVVSFAAPVSVQAGIVVPVIKGQELLLEKASKKTPAPALAALATPLAPSLPPTPDAPKAPPGVNPALLPPKPPRPPSRRPRPPPRPPRKVLVLPPAIPAVPPIPPANSPSPPAALSPPAMVQGAGPGPALVRAPGQQLSDSEKALGAPSNLPPLEASSTPDAVPGNKNIMIILSVSVVGSVLAVAAALFIYKYWSRRGAKGVSGSNHVDNWS